MEFRKLSPNGDSTSVTLPKQELEALGIVDEDGDLEGETWAKIQHEEEGVFSVQVVGAE